MPAFLRRPAAAWPAPSPAVVLLLAALAQLPLALNPGYYSHDELQWAARAAQGQWFPLAALDAFQYRPLTFNLWMALSRAFFDTPRLFHTLLVLWASANAALLCAVGRRFGLQPWPAALAALGFALSPYATYTAGWVGTLGDLAWLSCALGVAWLALVPRRATALVLASAALMAVGLLAKEAALAIPALAAVALACDPRRRRRWAWVLLGSGAVASAFLAVRAGALLHAPREGAQYALSPWHVPWRWLEYQLFPPVVPLLESFTLFGQGRLAPWLAAALWSGVMLALWQAGRRYLAWWWLAGAAALLPVLPLGSSWNHYAYGFAAVAALVLAAAWHDANRPGRVAIAAYALLGVLHGGVVMLAMHQVGRVQAVFSPALADAVQHSGSVPVRLRVAAGAREWVFVRLTHEIPAYHGVPIGARVRLVPAGADADYEVQADGRLRRL